MKPFPSLSRIIRLGLFCVVVLFSCHKVSNETDPGNPQNPPQSSLSSDALSDHLQFDNGVKHQGSAPQGPSGSSLKISFEDTLFLADRVKMPVKFLHMDTTQNVSGIFLQVQAVVNGSFASYYYDVPEVPIVDSSDTVSIILIGFDPTDVKSPTSFNIRIIPYNKDHQPIDEAVKPVKISPHHVNPNGSNGSCGLVTAQNETWDWVMSYMMKGTFTATPETIFGGDGQFVNGSCCNGFSVYGFCPGTRTTNARLHFNTFYQIAGEQLSFFDDKGFERRTVERGANPLPDSSDFCLPFEGRVSNFLSETFYEGHYVVTPANLPSDLQDYHDSLALQMTTESTTPQFSGYGNGGGIIHYLDCRNLVLIGVDPEGFGQHLVKIYQTGIFEKWFEF